MKAKIVKPVTDGFRDYRKPLISEWTIVTLYKGELKTVVRAECRMSSSRNAGTVYASLWVSGPTKETSGHGSAGGWGYHKCSAAVSDAITCAGIELYGSPYAYKGVVSRMATMSKQPEPEDLKKKCSIHGVGDAAIEAALMAIAIAAGYRGKKVFA